MIGIRSKMAETVKTPSLVVDPESREHITPSLKDLDDTEQRLTKRLDDTEQRLTNKLDKHDKRFDSIEKKLDSLLNAEILHFSKEVSVSHVIGL